MKRKIRLTPEQVEEIWEFIDKGHEIGPLGYSLEIDLPDEPEKTEVKENPQYRLNREHEKRITEIEKRLDAIDKRDSLQSESKEEIIQHIKWLEEFVYNDGDGRLEWNDYQKKQESDSKEEKAGGN